MEIAGYAARRPGTPFLPSAASCRPVQTVTRHARFPVLGVLENKHCLSCRESHGHHHGQEAITYVVGINQINWPVLSQSWGAANQRVWPGPAVTNQIGQ